MRLKSARVTNFKSVEDSTEFTLRDITCLVGKNEAGKTALLQALYKLQPVVEEESEFESLEYPRRKYSEYKERSSAGEEDNVITTTWELDDADEAAVVAVLGPHSLDSRTVTIEKGYPNEPLWSVEVNDKNVVARLINDAELTDEELARVKDARTVRELRGQVGDAGEGSVGELAVLNRISAFRDGSPLLAVIDALSSRLPTFVYFADYQKMPGQVAIDDLQRRQERDELDFGDRVFLALLDLVGTTAEDIATIGRFEQLVAELEAVSNRLSQEIFEYWSQNRHLDVEFRFDAAREDDPPPFNTGYVFRTRIKNRRHGVTVSFDERSSGFVWFFSFLVWFSQVKKNYGQNLVLLLDEPGLGLHAKAQEDLLRYIREKLAPQAQVIYTTHSPFMINPDDLRSARTVEDVFTDGSVEGTKVGDEALSTDVDTLFPLQAALGYDITQTLFVGRNTLLVEGPSDLLYLTWFSAELERRGRQRLDLRWTITPSGGLDKIGSFLALFGGSKLHVAVLTDFHQGDKRKVRDLRESELLRAGHVFTADAYVPGDEADVEDIIGRQAYVELVNRTYSLSGKQALPKSPRASSPVRVVEEVESHFKLLPQTTPGFDHFRPAAFLVENGGSLRDELAGLDEALGRFETLFEALSSLLDAP